MELRLKNTSKFVTVGAVRTRIWEGVSGHGVKCYAYIALVAVEKGEDQVEFAEELREVCAPSAVVAGLPSKVALWCDG